MSKSKMNSVNEAVRVLAGHTEVPRRVHTSLVVCICGQWRGHRDQHPIHLADALQEAGLLRSDTVDTHGLSKVEVTTVYGGPVHVLIEAHDVPIVNGYIVQPRPAPEPAQIDAQAPQEQPQDTTAHREPLEDRLRALAADMADTPFTATILRQFADEVAQMRPADDSPYHLGEIAAGWPALIGGYAERERRVRELTETIAGEYPDPSGVIQSIVARIREALDPTTPGRT